MYEQALAQVLDQAVLRREHKAKAAIVRSIGDLASTSPIFRTGASVSATKGMLYALVHGSSTAVMMFYEAENNATPHKAPALTWQDLLQKMQKKGLSVSNLASILTVSRPTIYSWIESHSIPNPEKQERIENVYKLFACLNSSELRLLPKVWLKSSSEESQSLFEMLTARELQVEDVNAALAEARPLLAKLASRIAQPRKSVATLVDETLATDNPSIIEWDRMPSVGREWPGGQII